jgi:hypothetical protein
LPTHVLDASPDHCKSEVAGLHGAIRSLSVDPDAVVIDLEDECARLGCDPYVDRGRVRVLHRVNHELFCDWEQERAGEGAVIGPCLDRQADRLT